MMASRIGLFCLLFVGCALTAGTGAEEPQSDSTTWSHYCPKQEVSGKVRINGSTTMQQLAALWADGFQQIHPKVHITIDCRGSESVQATLSKRQTSISLMSRPLSQEEQQQLSDDLGGRVVVLTVCYDALGVIVHKENPLQGVTYNEDVRLRSPADDTSAVTTWGDLGLSGDWASVPISAHAPPAQSGTRKYVDQLLPRNEEAERRVSEHGSRRDLIAAVASERSALGLVSLSRGALEEVRLIPVGSPGRPFVAPVDDQIHSRRYPLIRPLSLVFALQTETLEEPLLGEFVAYVLSRCGQQDVIKDGFLPLNRSELHEQEEKLGWNRLQ